MASRYKQITTPRGVFIYPHLTEADTKFVKPDGEYHTKFALTPEDAAPFIEVVEGVLEAYVDENQKELTPAQIKKALRADIYEEELDAEGEETGRYIFKFKLKAKVETKNKSWAQAPRLFDSKAQPISGDVNVWTGSEGKVNVELFPYYMPTTKSFGVSMRCIAAQILKLVEGSGASAGAMGFEAEDDGYTSNDTGFDDETGVDGDDGEF